MKDQIDLFAQRGKVGINDLSVFYILVAIVLMFYFFGNVSASGDEITKSSIYTIIFNIFNNFYASDTGMEISKG